MPTGVVAADSSESRPIEELAAFVHGALAAGHLLGLVYNLRRRKWDDATIHGAAMVYDTIAAYKHHRRSK